MPRGFPLSVDEKRMILIMWKQLKDLQKSKKKELGEVFKGMIVREMIHYLTQFGSRQIQKVISDYKKTGKI